MDELDLKDFGPENNHNYRYVSVIFDKSGWTVLLRNEKSQSGKNSFENIPISSKRKPNLIETDPDIGR